MSSEKKQNTKPDHHPARYIVGARTFPPGAEKRNMTLTDFLVSAALYKPSHAIKECKAILKKLNEVQAELLRAESDHPDYADVLAAQKELYQLLFLLARKETI